MKTWCEEKKLKEYQKLFGKSSKGNFFVEDTVPIPHPFTVGTRIVTYTSDHHGGMLGEKAILAYEEEHRRGACEHSTGIGKCQRMYDEHQSALLIACKIDMKDKKDDSKACKELHNYLLKNKKKCEKEKLAGFAFIDRREK